MSFWGVKTKAFTVEAWGLFSSDLIIKDTVALLLGGFDTVSHMISSFLYFLAKNLDVMKKLKNSFYGWGISNINKSDTSNLKDIYENCEYLNYVIKEVFRIDAPALSSLFYNIKENITFCGVPFKKGLKFYPNIHYTHYNPDEWFDPTKFIPERFDPESKY